MAKKSPLAPERFPTLPAVSGVELGVAEAGLKYRQRADVTFIRLSEGSQAAGVFTQSAVPGAPVVWSRAALAATGGKVRALVVNAGNANVFTGHEGEHASAETARAAAELVGCSAEEVMISSTGVIGEPLDHTAITKVLPNIAFSDAAWEAAAEAIGTTDTYAKGAAARTQIDGVEVTISGIAKGSGMIEPNMATMLGYIFTDAAISAKALDGLLRDATETSFNAITVDSDTSTSDTLLLIATGQAANSMILDPGDDRLGAFRQALTDVATSLAHQIVRDGEGASKFITIDVAGAKDDHEAKIVAKSVANSPLVKTAIAGEDANWGRVVMAVGKAGVPLDRNHLAISFGGILVSKGGGLAPEYDEQRATAHLKGQEISIEIDIGPGQGRATVWTCDLTHDYISINADYRS